MHIHKYHATCTLTRRRSYIKTSFKGLTCQSSVVKGGCHWVQGNAAGVVPQSILKPTGAKLLQGMVKQSIDTERQSNGLHLCAHNLIPFDSLPLCQLLLLCLRQTQLCNSTKGTLYIATANADTKNYRQSHRQGAEYRQTYTFIQACLHTNYLHIHTLNSDTD